jgi:hypothetical protein
MAVLILVSTTFLAVSADHNNLFEFVTILIVCIVLSDLSLAFLKGWDLLTFVVVTLLTTLVGVWVLSVFSVLIYILTFGLVLPASPKLPIIYGVRMASMVWPSAVLFIGMKHFYDESLKNKAKQEKSKKEALKAEQKL